MILPPFFRRGAVATATFLGLLAVCAGDAGAQSRTGGPSRPVVVRVGGMRDVAVCPCSSDGKPAPHDRDLFTVSVGSEWVIAGGHGPLQLSYAADLLPLIVSRNTADAALDVWTCGSDYCGQTNSPYPWTTEAVGAGALPIGFVTRARLNPAFALRARLSGGIVYMSRPVPVMQSRNFNFIAELGVGAELHVRHGLAISAGATQNHISNANTAPVNLGMDTRLLELGLVFTR